jgi:hypothetical protein
MYEVSFVINLQYVAYLLLGFGIGYLVVLGVTGGPSDRLERMKHDVAVKKEWFKLLAEANKNKRSTK